MNLPEHLALAAAKPASGTSTECYTAVDPAAREAVNKPQFWATIALAPGREHEIETARADIDLGAPMPGITLISNGLVVKEIELAHAQPAEDKVILSVDHSVLGEIGVEAFEHGEPGPATEIGQPNDDPENPEYAALASVGTANLPTWPAPVGDAPSTEVQESAFNLRSLDSFKTTTQFRRANQGLHQAAHQPTNHSVTTTQNVQPYQPTHGNSATEEVNTSHSHPDLASDADFVPAADAPARATSNQHLNSYSLAPANSPASFGGVPNALDLERAMGDRVHVTDNSEFERSENNFAVVNFDRGGHTNTGQLDTRLAPEFHKPNIRVVVDAVANLKQDGTVEVAMDPPEFGRIQLTMKGYETQMSVIVAAERPEAMEMIRRHIDVLRSELLAQGFTTFEFDLRDGNLPWAHSPERDDAVIEVDEADSIHDRPQNTIRVAAGRMDIRI